MSDVFKKRDGRQYVVTGFWRSRQEVVYKLFWMGGKGRSDGVGMFVAEKREDSVEIVERHNERVILKMVLDNGLLNVLTVYAPHSGKPEEEKENFGTNCST